MKDSDPEVMTLYRQAGGQPAEIAVDLLEQAMRRADSVSDVMGGYKVRMRLLKVYHELKVIDKLLVVFAWVVAKADAHEFDPYELMNTYYWATNWVTSTPDVPLARILAIHDDLERRAVELGHGVRDAYVARFKTLFRIGREGDAVECLEKFKKIGRSSRPDCEIGHEIEMLIRFGHDQKGLQKAGRFLKLESRCVNCCRNINSICLGGLLRLGRLEEAAGVHRVGYDLLGPTEAYLFSVPPHLLYNVRVGDLGRAVDIFERFLGGSLRSSDIDDRFSFFAAAATMFEKIAGERETVALRLPPDFPLRKADGQYRARELMEWFSAESLRLADRFDQRNQNGLYRRFHGEARKLGGLSD